MSDAPARRTGRPTLNEAVELQQAILDETLCMIGVAGIEGFSVDQLAMRIGVTKRTVYRHYRSKSGLIIAVVEREFDHLIHTLDRDSKERLDKVPDPLVRLRLWIKAFFDYMQSQQAAGFINFLAFESASNPEVGKLFLEWHNHVINYCSILVEEAQASGLIRSGNSKRFSLLLVDLVTTIHNRTKPNFSADDIFGGDDPELYFEFRWMGFLSLVSDHPWASFINLGKGRG